MESPANPTKGLPEGEGIRKKTELLYIKKEEANKLFPKVPVCSIQKSINRKMTSSSAKFYQ